MITNITQIFSILKKTPLMLAKITSSLGNGKKCLFTKIIQAITGEEDETALEALCKDPNTLLKFQNVIVEHEKSLRELEQRNRENAYKKAIELKSQSRLMLFVTVSGLLGCIFSLIYYHDTLTIDIISILGSVTFLFGSCLKDIFIFEYGLSDIHRSKLGSFTASYRPLKKRKRIKSAH